MLVPSSVRAACSRWDTPSRSLRTSLASSRRDPGELVGADLATAEVPGFETVVADARSLPFPDRSFDQVLLVSTLEHIGADNEVYGVQGEPDDSGRAAALRELRRVLHPAGSLLVTVPLGEPGDYGWFRQEDVRGWTRLFTGAGFFVEEQEAYELGEEGWRSAPDVRPGRRRLRHARPGGVGCAVCRAQPAAVAAARLSRRRSAHRATPARAVVPEAARQLERAGQRPARQRLVDQAACVSAPAVGSSCQSVILPSAIAEHGDRGLAGAVAHVTRASRQRERRRHLVALVDFFTILPPQGSEELNASASASPVSSCRRPSWITTAPGRRARPRPRRRPR